MLVSIPYLMKILEKEELKLKRLVWGLVSTVLDHGRLVPITFGPVTAQPIMAGAHDRGATYLTAAMKHSERLEEAMNRIPSLGTLPQHSSTKQNLCYFFCSFVVLWKQLVNLTEDSGMLHCKNPLSPKQPKAESERER